MSISITPMVGANLLRKLILVNQEGLGGLPPTSPTTPPATQTPPAPNSDGGAPAGLNLRGSGNTPSTTGRLPIVVQTRSPISITEEEYKKLDLILTKGNREGEDSEWAVNEWAFVAVNIRKILNTRGRITPRHDAILKKAAIRLKDYRITTRPFLTIVTLKLGGQLTPLTNAQRELLDVIVSKFKGVSDLNEREKKIIKEAQIALKRLTVEEIKEIEEMLAKDGLTNPELDFLRKYLRDEESKKRIIDPELKGKMVYRMRYTPIFRTRLSVGGYVGDLNYAKEFTMGQDLNPVGYLNAGLTLSLRWPMHEHYGLDFGVSGEFFLLGERSLHGSDGQMMNVRVSPILAVVGFMGFYFKEFKFRLGGGGMLGNFNSGFTGSGFDTPPVMTLEVSQGYRLSERVTVGARLFTMFGIGKLLGVGPRTLTDVVNSMNGWVLGLGAYIEFNAGPRY